PPQGAEGAWGRARAERRGRPGPTGTPGRVKNSTSGTPRATRHAPNLKSLFSRIPIHRQRTPPPGQHGDFAVFVEGGALENAQAQVGRQLLEIAQRAQVNVGRVVPLV